MKHNLNLIVFGADGGWAHNHIRILKDEMGFNSEHLTFFEIDEWTAAHELSGWQNNIWDGAIVATSSVNHFPILADLRRCGIPVLCEKPVCTSEKQLATMSSWLSAPPPGCNEKWFMMAGHQLVFAPEVQAAAAFKPSFMLSLRSGAIPREEGAVLSLAVHDIAMALHLYGHDDLALIRAEGTRHNAIIELSGIQRPFRALILAQSLSSLKMRHTVFVSPTVTASLSPDNWSRIDLLKLELEEFLSCIYESREPAHNDLADTVSIMKLALKANARLPKA